jgi:hypothetical protein
MPYISLARRAEFDETGKTGHHPKMEVAGELNYEITLKCLKYLKRHSKSYATINEIVGALECAKLEFYRRLAAPYEDTKIIENGDVYPTRRECTTMGDVDTSHAYPVDTQQR